MWKKSEQSLNQLQSLVFALFSPQNSENVIFSIEEAYRAVYKYCCHQNARDVYLHLIRWTDSSLEREFTPLCFNIPDANIVLAIATAYQKFEKSLRAILPVFTYLVRKPSIQISRVFMIEYKFTNQPISVQSMDGMFFF
eukprot:Sdes_comp23145_c0_seq1m21447